MMVTGIKRLILIILSSFIFYTGNSDHYIVDAAETDVPEELQAAIFLKALSYDSIVTGGSHKVVNIGVIVNPKSNKSVANKENFIESVNSLKQGITFFSKETFLSTKPVHAIPINAASLASFKKNEISILYLTEDLNSVPSIAKYARDNKVLTLSSDSENVRNGHASVSVMTRNNRPKLLINLKNSKLEGHELGEKVLKFSEVID
jgi:hypothetical protein